jgi:hypothetical protein
LNNSKLAHLEDDFVRQSVEDAKAYTQKLTENIEKSNTGWFFGLPEPSALDAHAIVFLQRMVDLERFNLVSQPLRAYLERAREIPAWQKISGGKSTRPF